MLVVELIGQMNVVCVRMHIYAIRKLDFGLENSERAAAKEQMEMAASFTSPLLEVDGKHY